MPCTSVSSFYVSPSSSLYQYTKRMLLKRVGLNPLSLNGDCTNLLMRRQGLRISLIWFKSKASKSFLQNLALFGTSYEKKSELSSTVNFPALRAPSREPSCNGPLTWLSYTRPEMYLPDDKSMYCLSTPAYKPDYKSFKFNDHPEEMKGLKTDKKPSLKFESSIISGLNSEHYEADSDSLPDDCQNEDLDRNLPAVSGSTAWTDSDDKRDQYSNRSRDTNQSEERKNLHNTESTVVNELPELDVFFHESSYQFVKDICIDSGLSSQGKCLLENCELDHNSISRLLNSDVDTNSELTEESLETASSVSNGSRHSTEQGCNKDEIKQRSSKGFMVKDEPNFDERYEISDHSRNKIITEIQLPVGQAPSEEALLENAIVSSTTEAVNNSHPKKTSFKIEVEGGSVTNFFTSSTTTKRSGEELPQDAASQQPPQTGMLSFSIDGPLSGLPKSGSTSLRSMSSTASSHSFAFPILPGEWTGSPVRMAKADRGQLPKHRRWRLCFPCP